MIIYKRLATTITTTTTEVTGPKIFDHRSSVSRILIIMSTICGILWKKLIDFAKFPDILLAKETEGDWEITELTIREGLKRFGNDLRHLPLGVGQIAPLILVKTWAERLSFKTKKAGERLTKQQAVKWSNPGRGCKQQSKLFHVASSDSIKQSLS